MQGLYWFWIGIALTLPTAIGILVAIPVWRWGKDPMIRGVLGMFPVFMAVIAFIGREFIELERYNQRCRGLVNLRIVCHNPNPDAFTRFAIYAFIGIAEALGLFILSLVVEERIRRRDYAREWQ